MVFSEGNARFPRRKVTFLPKKKACASVPFARYLYIYRLTRPYVSVRTIVCVREQRRSSRILRPFLLILETIFRMSHKCYIDLFFYLVVIYCLYYWGVICYIDVYCSVLVLFCISLTSLGSLISIALVSFPGISRGKRGYFDKVIGQWNRVRGDNGQVSF